MFAGHLLSLFIPVLLLYFVFASLTNAGALQTVKVSQVINYLLINCVAVEFRAA